MFLDLSSSLLLLLSRSDTSLREVSDFPSWDVDMYYSWQILRHVKYLSSYYAPLCLCQILRCVKYLTSHHVTLICIVIVLSDTSPSEVSDFHNVFRQILHIVK